uniref:Uncharacterized protein n=1 Tax=Arundo donax TaxID=35708 RepID=A0A0A9BFY0_ARUDO
MPRSCIGRRTRSSINLFTLLHCWELLKHNEKWI